MDAPPRIIYVCSLCLRQYDLLEDLRGHMMCYHDCRPLNEAKRTPSLKKTETCRAASPAPPSGELQPLPFKDFRIVLRAHMRVPCNAGSGCPYKFEDELKLGMHTKCHKGEAYSCSECGLDISNWRRCSAHLWKCHQIDADLLQCPALGCDYKSPISALVWRHMRVHTKWRGRVMQREMLRRRALKQRQLRQQQEEQQNNPQQHLLASDSQEATTSTQPPTPTLKKTKYYAEKTCEICQRKFVNGKTLSKHVKTVHNKIKPFICNVCGKKTARKASLIIHMRQHTGEKPLKCEQCKFSTRDPSSLYKHRQRHGKEEANKS